MSEQTPTSVVMPSARSDVWSIAFVECRPKADMVYAVMDIDGDGSPDALCMQNRRAPTSVDCYTDIPDVTQQFFQETIGGGTVFPARAAISVRRLDAYSSGDLTRFEGLFKKHFPPSGGMRQINWDRSTMTYLNLVNDFGSAVITPDKWVEFNLSTPDGYLRLLTTKRTSFFERHFPMIKDSNIRRGSRNAHAFDIR